ncbi:hypothetical protein [Legionella tunisiensis]|uniref:hypothetical protein n=1 Tax=Legionella tunisiensis TaxID=1034944 RepID=UPI000311E9DB|nr:hypothetical protein [Legionella tunisiensis]
MNLFDPEKLLNIGYAISLFLVGYIVAKRLGIIAERALVNHFSRHHTMLIKRSVFMWFYYFSWPASNILVFT